MWVVGSRHQTTHTQTHTQQLPSYRQKRLTTTPRERDPTSLSKTVPQTANNRHNARYIYRPLSLTLPHILARARRGPTLPPGASSQLADTQTDGVCGPACETSFSIRKQVQKGVILLTPQMHNVAHTEHTHCRSTHTNTPVWVW